jgi:CRP/FNR family cyclic AMP-dependent transcriptional regulator
MAGGVNQLNDDRSRLISRMRQAGVPAEVLDEIMHENIVARYARRIRLFFQGAPADVLMVIINGVVKVYCTQPDGRRFLVELAGPGDVIGYVDRLDAKGRSCQAFDAQALTNCAVAIISRQRVLKLLAESGNSTIFALFERLNTFWGSLVYRYASMMTLSYRERLESMLLEVAARFGVKDARGTMLTLELGHDDWAEMIGSSRPMVSRLIADMVQNRVLAREGKHYILLANGAAGKTLAPEARLGTIGLNGVSAMKHA